MKKGWRIILTIVLVVLILGGVSFGVGLLTGGDIDRIILNLDEHYQVMTYINTYTGYVRQLFQQLVNLFF